MPIFEYHCTTEACEQNKGIDDLGNPNRIFDLLVSNTEPTPKCFTCGKDFSRLISSCVGRVRGSMNPVRQ